MRKQSNKFTIDEIEDYLDKKIASLDPKIRSRFVYQFMLGDGIDVQKKIRQFANTSNSKPPVITFFTEVLEKHHFLPENLDGLINHEIVHTFGFGERMAHEKEDNINFTKHV